LKPSALPRTVMPPTSVSLGRTAAERGVIAFLADTSSKSSAYENNISSLRTGGFIEYRARARSR
jgi:hypothetical protein